MQKGITYTKPLLYPRDPASRDIRKSWYVGFEITNLLTGEVDRVQKRGGINYAKTIKERTADGNALCDYWETKLKAGWHRFKIVETPSTENKVLELQNLTFSTGIAWALKKLSVKKSTRKAYNGTARFVLKAAALPSLRLTDYPIESITHQHILLLLDEVQEMQNWSNKAYNKHACYLSAILAPLEQWKIIPSNPGNGVCAKPTSETNKFVPYTESEKQEIAGYFFKKCYGFLVLWITHYFTGIRPTELLALKIKDVDLANRLITILPDRDAGNSKNNRIRYVPISDALLPFLLELKVSQYPKEYYLFGSVYESGKGARGKMNRGNKSRMHPDYFKPSPYHIKEDTVNRYWRSEVKEWLQIDKYFYAAKKSGANAMILAGISLESLKEMYGHHSVLVTQIYADQVFEVHRKAIISQSPNFFSDATVQHLLPSQSN